LSAFGITVLVIFRLPRPSCSTGEEFANRHPELLRVAIDGFLAVDTKGRPWHCRQALRMNVVIAPLAYPKAAILN
jgi:hypothetical protein